MSGSDLQTAQQDSFDTVRHRYARSGIGGRVGFGSRPALLIVDFRRGFTDSASGVGGDLSKPIQVTQTLLELARKRI